MSEQVINTEEPADAKLFVDYQMLSDDGAELVNQAGIINENISNIRTWLQGDWDVWIGEDKEEYVKTLKRELLQNLANYASEINRVGAFMGRMSEKYTNQLNATLERLSENE